MYLHDQDRQMQALVTRPLKYKEAASKFPGLRFGNTAHWMLRVVSFRNVAEMRVRRTLYETQSRSEAFVMSHRDILAAH